MNDPIIDKLSKYIAATILKQPNRVIQPDQPLISSGMIDSFSLVDLALFIEDQFNVRIEDTELNSDHFDTLNELVRLINTRRT